MDWWVAPKEHELQSDLGCYFNGLARLIDWVAINYDLLLPHKPTGECDGANIEQETCYNTIQLSEGGNIILHSIEKVKVTENKQDKTEVVGGAQWCTLHFPRGLSRVRSSCPPSRSM